MLARDIATKPIVMAVETPVTDQPVSRAMGTRKTGTLQFGLKNQGQEFGTYGPYNRVLRVVRGMNEFEVERSRLSRRLDWRNLGHLDSFSIDLRDTHGRTGSIVFVYGTPEISERDTVALERIIRSKFVQATEPQTPPVGSSLAR
ncbi:MAG: hypothetical protein ACREIA_00850 [Opitutaceae bacterium]